MDVFMVVMRLIHIFAGIYWVGVALFFGLVIAPVAADAGALGGPFMLRLYGRSVFVRSMPIASILTVLSGLAMYDTVSNHFDSDWMSSANGIVLSIGAVAGILAFGHGLMGTGKYNRQMESMAKTVLAQGGTPTAEQGSQMAAIGAKVKTNAQISTVLMIIAVIGMASARWV